MSMYFDQAMRGYGLGAKYGVLEGFRRFHETAETPKMDETAMQGAIGIIIAVGGVLIALYIIAVVVGSISYAVTSGNIKLSPTWNTTITKERRVLQRYFDKISVLKGFPVGEHRQPSPSNLQSGQMYNSQCIKNTLISADKCVADRNYWSGYPDDRYRCILWSWHLSEGKRGLRASCA